jgi:hypothetical protein
MVIPRAIRPEIDRFDVGGFYVSVANGYSSPLTAIAAGTAAGDRIGVNIRPLHLELRGFIRTPAANLDMVRVMIVRLLYDSSTINVNQIVENTSSPYGVVSAPNWDYFGQEKADRRFEILYDQRFTVSPNWHADQHFVANLDLSKAERALIKYPQAGGTTPVLGGLHLISFSTSAFATSASVGFYSRLQYYDA